MELASKPLLFVEHYLDVSVLNGKTTSLLKIWHKTLLLPSASLFS